MKKSPSVKDAVALVTVGMTHADFNRSGDWVDSAAEIAIRAFCRRTQPNTLLSHLESNCSKICEQMERKFRRPLSNVLPLLPWMPTTAAIMMISLAEEAAREDAATEILEARGAEAKSFLTEAFTQEKVRSV